MIKKRHLCIYLTNFILLIRRLHLEGAWAQLTFKWKSGMKLSQESLYINAGDHRLHLRHIWGTQNKPVVVMFHGVIEDGSIFYKNDDKGLANFLARNDFDVYVVDFRGKGRSTPTIMQNSEHGQQDVILGDIPSVIGYLRRRTGQRINVICHSWGGVLFSSAYVRSNGFDNGIASIICFGTKRRVSVWNMDRIIKVSLFWNNLAPLISRRRGYLDAKYYGIGGAPETRKFIKQSVEWVRKKRWVDPVDQFNYYSAAKHIKWPPTWYMTGVSDFSLGHATDVFNFLKETHHPDARFTVLSKDNGNLINYDHINILTHRLAEQDHFISICDWLSLQSSNGNRPSHSKH